MVVHAISDMHGTLPHIPPGDVLLIAGDIVPLDCHSPDKSARFLDTHFRRWLDKVPCTHVVATWGNHDFIGEREPRRVPHDLRWTVLVDEGLTLDFPITGETLWLWGTPWQPPFLNWAFNLPEPELAEKFAAIPTGLDVLIAHSPPLGILDRTPDGRRVGSTALRNAVLRAAPTAMVFGHIHDQHGHAKLGTTDCFNVSLVDDRYQPKWGATTIPLTCSHSHRI